MPLKASQLKKLASLSAIGAGAVALTADKAEASSIQYTPVHQTVGFAAADLPVVPLNLPSFSGSRVSFGFVRASGTNSYSFGRAILGVGGSAPGARFATRIAPVISSSSVPVIKIVPAGKTWFQVSSSSGRPFGFVAARLWGSYSGKTFHSAFGNTNSFTNQYALFQFGPAFAPLYGWVELSLSITDAYGPICASPSCGDPNGYGPELNVIGYAYDTSGAPIAAGAGVPEPDTFVATGLAALALGAAGMRRWRKSKKAA